MSTGQSSFPRASSPIRDDYGTLSQNLSWTQDLKKRALLELAKEVSGDDFVSTYLSATDENQSWSSTLTPLVKKLEETIENYEDETDLYSGDAPLLQLLNGISIEVFRSLPSINPPRKALVFLSCHDKPIPNPYGGSPSPDFVVLEEEANTLFNLAEPNLTETNRFSCPVPRWHTVIATGESKVWKTKDRSTKQTNRNALSKGDDAIAQMAKYLLHNLQNRSNQGAVLGLATIGDHYRLFYHDAGVVRYSSPFGWNPGPIFAFVRKLYVNSFSDPSMLVVPSDNPTTNSKPTWAINIEGDTLVTNNPMPEMGLGQRRFVCVATDVNTGQEYFVKDIWRNRRGRFIEAELCNKAHKLQHLPGLMSVVHSSGVLDVDGEQISTVLTPLATDGSVADVRDKTRLYTLDVGRQWDAIETVQGFLRVMYDACVVQRNIYTKSQIMHRDISEGNIMVAPLDEDFYTRCAEGYDKIKYINQVLLAKEPDRERKPRPACLVVDFGHGVDLEEAQGDPKLLADRTGTPKFIARSVSYGGLLPFRGHQSNEATMPILEGSALDLYTRIYGEDRYNYYIELLQGEQPQLTPAQRSEIPFTHQLFHDAESVFWVIAWLLVHSAPPGSEKVAELSPELEEFLSKMQQHRPFNKIVDDRDKIMSFENWESMLHDDLTSLAPMLSEMCAYVSPEWAFRTDLQRAPEHVHEALMRLLLKEIVRFEETEDIPLKIKSRSMPKIDLFKPLDWNSASRSRTMAPQSAMSNTANQASGTTPNKQAQPKPKAPKVQTKVHWLAAIKRSVEALRWSNLSYGLKHLNRKGKLPLEQ